MKAARMTEMKMYINRMFINQHCEMVWLVELLNEFFNSFGGHNELAKLRKLLPAVLECGDLDILAAVLSKILAWVDDKNKNFNDDLQMYIRPAEGEVLVLEKEVIS